MKTIRGRRQWIGRNLAALIERHRGLVWRVIGRQPDRPTIGRDDLRQIGEFAMLGAFSTFTPTAADACAHGANPYLCLERRCPGPRRLIAYLLTVARNAIHAAIREHAGAVRATSRSRSIAPSTELLDGAQVVVSPSVRPDQTAQLVAVILARCRSRESWELVRAMRHTTDQEELGRSLGITQQAVSKRLLRLRQELPPDALDHLRSILASDPED